MQAIKRTRPRAVVLTARMSGECAVLALVSTLVLARAPAALAADPLKAGFWSGGREHGLLVDKDHVVVTRAAAGDAKRPAILNATEAAAFDMMGTAVIPRSSLVAGLEPLGVPVWFERDAVGVLTDEIVIRPRTEADLAGLRGLEGFRDLRPATGLTGLHLARFQTPLAALAAANELTRRRQAVFAHPNFMLPKIWRGATATAPRAAGMPDGEPMFNHQWHLRNTAEFGGTAGADIHVDGAWEVTRGHSGVLIAVLDGGFETGHRDFEGAWYRNPGETAGNGIDDDGNGYVDDVGGWNFWSGTPDVTVGVVDEHGTAVAGLVGGRVNGVGMTGVCPDCTLLAVTVSWKVADDAAAFRYAQSMGAQVITNSWGYAVGTPATDVVVEAINAVEREGRDGKGTIILFAMNNINQDDCVASRPDISSLESVIAVSGASDQDRKVTHSAWGPCMEFLAPTYETNRKGIATADLSGTRGYNNGRYPGDLPDLAWTNDFGGTSAATPIAAGVFALMLAVNPELTRDQALAMVVATADKIAPELANYDSRTGFSNKYGYGRINATKAVRAAEVFRKYGQRQAPPPPATPAAAVPNQDRAGLPRPGDGPGRSFLR